jgi:transmembrane sensor
MRWFARYRGPKTAAQWFAARLHGLDSRRERRFQRWLAADPRHAEDYALCEITWEVSRGPADLVPLPMVRTSRRSLMGAGALGVRQGALGAMALAAALTGIAIWFLPIRTDTWTTAAGEQRTVVLRDGTRVTLNTRTQLTARLSGRARDVRLTEGEAFFEVSKDPARPFTVTTTLGSARALGTRFNVYLAAQGLEVTTEEGRVLVRNADAGPGVTVDAGHRAELHMGQVRADLSTVDLHGTLSWMTQRLDVNDEPLDQVLRDMSRYTEWPVRADTPAIGALHVSAVLQTGDMEALRAMLNGAFGLDVEHRGNEWVVVDPRRRASGR